jgi:YD repeat-containing protein
MKALSILSLTLLTTQIPIKTRAAVNMKYGNYKTSASDIPGVQRTYNSRSLYRGVFGFGWCSNLDIKLIIRDGQPMLDECGVQTPAPEEAKRLFDRAGRPLMVNAMGGRLKLTYSPNGNLSSLRDTRGKIWQVSHSSDGSFIQQFLTSHGREVSFSYQGPDLIQVRDSSRTTFAYKYDDLHNLTAVTTNEDRSEQIRYEPDRDLVLEYVRVDGCQESFTYSNLKTPVGVTEVAAAVIDCGAAHSTVVHEFQYSIYPGGGALLSKTKSTVNGEVRELRDYTREPAVERRPARRGFLRRVT